MIDVIKMIVSFLTPVTILIFGILINRKLEKNKIDFIKEKEWQIHWSKRFIDTAYELNTNISLFICALFDSQKATEKEQLGINETISKYRKAITVNEWEIRNYVQFAEYNRKDVIDTLSEILIGLTEILKKRQGDIEPIRQKQFDFNKAVRKAHAEILNIKTVHSDVYGK